MSRFNFYFILKDLVFISHYVQLCVFLCWFCASYRRLEGLVGTISVIQASPRCVRDRWPTCTSKDCVISPKPGHSTGSLVRQLCTRNRKLLRHASVHESWKPCWNPWWLSIVKCRKGVNSACWWPKISFHIEHFVGSCEYFQERLAVRKEPLSHQNYQAGLVVLLWGASCNSSARPVGW
jgi:hypothetical protein